MRGGGDEDYDVSEEELDDMEEECDNEGYL